MPQALKLPADAIGNIFRTHADALKTDINLKHIAANLLLQDDAPNNSSPDIIYPWVRLSLSMQKPSMKTSKAGRLSVEFPFRIHVETTVNSTRLEDSTRLGWAILNAWFPEDATLRARLESNLAATGMISREVEQYWTGVPVFGPPDRKLFPATPYIYAHGYLAVSISFDL